MNRIDSDSKLPIETSQSEPVDSPIKRNVDSVSKLDSQ